VAPGVALVAALEWGCDPREFEQEAAATLASQLACQVAWRGQRPTT
jgi:hypothetical protein